MRMRRRTPTTGFRKLMKMWRKRRYASIICIFLCAIGGGRAAGKPESCEGLDNIIAKSAATLQCQRNDDCLSLDCNATDLAGFGAVLLLHPCDKPPAIELFFKTPDGLSPVGEFDSSDPIRTTGAPLMEGVEFQITVSWITNQTVSLSSRIVRNDNDVTLLTVIEPTNITLMCMPASRPATTCLALQQIAQASDEELKCTTNGEKNECDTLICSATLNSVTVTTTLTVLPCGDIPAVHITIGSVFVDQELSESQEITIFPNFATADVTLNQLDGAIGIQVDVITTVGGVIQPFNYTEIPINKSQCTDGQNTTMSSENTTMSSENTTMSSENTTMSSENTTMSSENTTMSSENTTMNSDAMILMSLPHAFLMVLSLFHQLLY